MDCNNCYGEIPVQVRYCPRCQEDVGFPNVRATQTPEEKQALTERLQRANISTDARSCKSNLDEFGKAVAESKSVFCRNLDVVHNLISSQNALYITFHKSVAAGARLPKNDVWELGRPAAEATLFPHYFEEISIACLTLNNTGLTNYGAYSIVLKDVMIAKRASVFEENPFLFMEKHRVIAGQQIPAGYRAAWRDRNLFAMAKLHDKIDSSTKTDEFPGILMKPGATGREDEFIEVHIYGAIHPGAFERIVGPRPTKRDELVLWKSIQSSCKKIGIIVEEL